MPAIVSCSLVTLAAWVAVGYTAPQSLPVSPMEREGYTPEQLTWQFAFRMVSRVGQTVAQLTVLPYVHS